MHAYTHTTYIHTYKQTYPRLERKARIILRTRGYLRSRRGNRVPDLKVLPVYTHFTLLSWMHLQIGKTRTFPALQVDIHIRALCMHTYTQRTYIHTCIHTYIHLQFGKTHNIACLAGRYTYALYVYIHTHNIHRYIRTTYIDTYRYTHVHTYTCNSETRALLPACSCASVCCICPRSSRA